MRLWSSRGFMPTLVALTRMSQCVDRFSQGFLVLRSGWMVTLQLGTASGQLLDSQFAVGVEVIAGHG